MLSYCRHNCNNPIWFVPAFWRGTDLHCRTHFYV